MLEVGVFDLEDIESDGEVRIDRIEIDHVFDAIFRDGL